MQEDLAAALVGGLLQLALLAAWVVTLVDAARQPDERWKRAHRSQVVWLVAIALVCGIAGIIYWAAVRPSLTRAGREIARHGPDPDRVDSESLPPPTAQDLDLDLPDEGWDEFQPEDHRF